MRNVSVDLLLNETVKAIHQNDTHKALRLARKALQLKPFDQSALAYIDFLTTDTLPDFLI